MIAALIRFLLFMDAPYRPPANPWWREDADEERVQADRIIGQSALVVEE